MDDKTKEYLKGIKECDHLFLKVKDKEDYYGFHSSDCGSNPPLVVCLKCGLTNKHIEMNYKTKKNCDMILSNMNNTVYEIIKQNDEEFIKLYSSGYRRNGKSFDESVLPLISDKVLPAINPHYVYEQAIKKISNGTNEEIFEEMVRINEASNNNEISKVKTLNKNNK
jgi:hypothetical protein